MVQIRNNPAFKVWRANLRNDMTPFEKKIWFKLRNRQFYGIKWRRQFSIGRYILDFYAPEIQVCIEIDGQSHAKQVEYDNRRTLYLNGLGITVLRYSNREVCNNLEGVLEDMRIKLTTPPAFSHLPTPPSLP